MSEPTGLKVEIGGPLPKSLIPELLRALQEDMYDIDSPVNLKINGRQYLFMFSYNYQIKMIGTPEGPGYSIEL